MNIKLFIIQNRVVLPSEYCYLIIPFKNIIDNYPNNHLKILSYIFFMSCRNAENPYLNRPSDTVEEEILADIEADFMPEDDLIQVALAKAKDMYETPTTRAHDGMAAMLDKLSFYMHTQEITDGRDGNITAIVSAGKNLAALRKSFKELAKDVEEEAALRNRGGSRQAYDEDGD